MYMKLQLHSILQSYGTPIKDFDIKDLQFRTLSAQNVYHTHLAHQHLEYFTMSFKQRHPNNVTLKFPQS